jgi:hypothetical protein
VPTGLRAHPLRGRRLYAADECQAKAKLLRFVPSDDPTMIVDMFMLSLMLSSRPLGSAMQSRIRLCISRCISFLPSLKTVKGTKVLLQYESAQHGGGHRNPHHGQPTQTARPRLVDMGRTPSNFTNTSLAMSLFPVFNAMPLGLSSGPLDMSALGTFALPSELPPTTRHTPTRTNRVTTSSLN